MSDTSNWPPLIGKQRKTYLARCFGSVDGTAAAVVSQFNRRRLRARYRYEEAYAALWQADAGRFCNTEDDVEAAKMAAHHSVGEQEAWHRNVLKRPALLHVGLMKSFVEPFGKNDTMPLDAYCTVGSAHEAPVSAMRASVPEARVKYLCFRAWSPDETPIGVPPEWREWFNAAMDYERQAHDEALEAICRHYGSNTGLPVDITAENHAAAACYWRRWCARQEMRTQYEYDLYVIDTDECEAEQATEAHKRAADEARERVCAVAAHGFG